MGSQPESPGQRDKDRDGGLAHPRVGPWAYSRASDIVQADPVLVLDYEKSHGQGHGANFSEHGDSCTGLS